MLSFNPCVLVRARAALGLKRLRNFPIKSSSWECLHCGAVAAMFASDSKADSYRYRGKMWDCLSPR